MREIGFGVIGAGLMGREFASAAARWLHLLDVDVRPRIVAVADPDADRRRWFAEQVVGDGGVYETHHELLARDDVEAVYCAVPHNLHEDIYGDVIAAGKHLFGEKPFGIDAAANARILEAARSRPDLLVRCSSEFPFFPGPRRVMEAVGSGRLGEIFEVRAAFNHSSDLDPGKPINWKRMVDVNGAYGCLGDLGMHVLHLPLRLGWRPENVYALCSDIVRERPGPGGEMVPCLTWDNATLACTSVQGFTMLLETKRISPGDMNTWTIEVYGTRGSVRYSTKDYKTFWSLDYEPGGLQAWSATDLGYESAYPAITGGIFEFGFADAILQMWAAFCDELVHGGEMRGDFRCATLEETEAHHAVLTAAMRSAADGRVAAVPGVEDDTG